MCVSANTGQPRKLWKVFSSMMGRGREESATPGKPSAQSLLDYFIKKIDDIRQSTGSSPASTKLPPSPNLLHSFVCTAATRYGNWSLLQRQSHAPWILYRPACWRSSWTSFFQSSLTCATNRCWRANFHCLSGMPPSHQSSKSRGWIAKTSKTTDQYQIWLTCRNSSSDWFASRSRLSWKENNLLPRHQPSFRARHSTETAVLKVMSDILAAADDGRVTLLGLLDMSAAFDTVDHHILLQRLESSFGLTGTVLSLLASFLTGRTQQVIFNGMTSIVAALSSGVPQGSVLGPLLFLLYTADIPVIASDHGLGVHCYADDGQLYVSERPGNAGSVISKVTVCIAEIDNWMSSNRLKLNSEKTQFIWLGSCQQLQKVSRIHRSRRLHVGFSVLGERSWSADRQPTYNEGTRATSMPNVFLPASPALRHTKFPINEDMHNPGSRIRHK